MNFFTKDEQISTADLLAFIRERLNGKTSFFAVFLLLPLNLSLATFRILIQDFLVLDNLFPIWADTQPGDSHNSGTFNLKMMEGRCQFHHPLPSSVVFPKMCFLERG